MFLRQIRLENTRSLRDLSVAFIQREQETNSRLPVRKWTLMLGENGLGKSTVLRSIALVTAGSDALPELLGDPDTWITLNAKEGLIEAELETAEGEVRKLRLAIPRGRGISEILKLNSTNLQPLDAALKYTQRSYFVVGYGVSRRLPRRESSITGKRSSNARRVGPVATLFDPDAALNPLETWAMDLDYRSGSKALGVIRETINNTLPNVRFAKVDKRKRRLLFRTPDGIVPLSALSDGYQNVAGWLGDLLYCVTDTFADFAKPLDARGLLLIDELDLHLHPTWQRRVREFLNARLPNFQIVATTHSALTAHQSGPGELHYLERVEGIPRIRAFEGDPSKIGLPQLIASPIFGLNTLDSAEVEEKKNEYRRLRKTSQRQRLSTRSSQRMYSLARELQDIPNPTLLTAQERKLARTLASIRQGLGPPRTGAKITKRRPILSRLLRGVKSKKKRK